MNNLIKDKCHYQELIMTIEKELTFLDSDVIGIIKDYLKPFPFKKEIESLHSERKTERKTEYIRFHNSSTNYWDNFTIFHNMELKLEENNKHTINDHKRVISCYSYSETSNYITHYAYCKNCSLKYKEETWHHYRNFQM